MRVSQFLQFGCRRAPAPEMDADDPGRAFRDQAPHGFGIDIVGGGVYVSKNGRDPLPVQCVRRRNERIGGDDNLAAQPQRPNGYFERNRAIAHRDAMLRFMVIRNALLELLHYRAVIGQPTPIKKIIDSLFEPLPIADKSAGY